MFTLNTTKPRRALKNDLPMSAPSSPAPSQHPEEKSAFHLMEERELGPGLRYENKQEAIRKLSAWQNQWPPLLAQHAGIESRGTHQAKHRAPTNFERQNVESASTCQSASMGLLLRSQCQCCCRGKQTSVEAGVLYTGYSSEIPDQFWRHVQNRAEFQPHLF